MAHPESMLSEGVREVLIHHMDEKCAKAHKELYASLQEFKVGIESDL